MKLFALFTVTQCSVMNYRYKDVIDLAKRYWESNGENFDATKVSRHKNRVLIDVRNNYWSLLLTSY